jgi:hypothetical protein
MTRTYFKERLSKTTRTVGRVGSSAEIRTANLPNTSQKHLCRVNPLTEKLTVVELVMKLSVLYITVNVIMQGDD